MSLPSYVGSDAGSRRNPVSVPPTSAEGPDALLGRGPALSRRPAGLPGAAGLGGGAANPLDPAGDLDGALAAAAVLCALLLALREVEFDATLEIVENIAAIPDGGELPVEIAARANAYAATVVALARRVLEGVTLDGEEMRLAVEIADRIILGGRVAAADIAVIRETAEAVRAAADGRERNGQRARADGEALERTLADATNSLIAIQHDVQVQQPADGGQDTIPVAALAQLAGASRRTCLLSCMFAMLNLRDGPSLVQSGYSGGMAATPTDPSTDARAKPRKSQVLSNCEKIREMLAQLGAKTEGQPLAGLVQIPPAPTRQGERNRPAPRKRQQKKYKQPETATGKRQTAAGKKGVPGSAGAGRRAAQFAGTGLKTNPGRSRRGTGAAAKKGDGKSSSRTRGGAGSQWTAERGGTWPVDAVDGI